MYVQNIYTCSIFLLGQRFGVEWGKRCIPCHYFIPNMKYLQIGSVKSNRLSLGNSRSVFSQSPSACLALQLKPLQLQHLGSVPVYPPPFFPYCYTLILPVTQPRGKAGHSPAEDPCLKWSVLPVAPNHSRLLRWAGAAGDSLVQPSAQSRVSCSRLISTLPSWVLNTSPRMETPPSLWETCTSVWPSS